MQLEAEEPSHGTFAALCYTLEDLVDVYPLVLAHPERGAVNETDSGTLAQQDFLDEDGQWNGNLLFQFYESVV